MTHTTEYIYRMTCDECDRPALTLDLSDRPRCPKHASVFISASDTEEDDGDEW